MLSYWVAIIMGIVEGLTEFLPVSSTGHLILTQALLGIPEDNSIMKTFEVVIQLGAILAVVVIYWNRILLLFGLKKDPSRAGKKKLNLIHILIGILPAGIIGLLVNNWIEEHLFSPKTVLLSLIVGGVLLIIAEKSSSRKTAQELDDITYRQAFYIGLYQILAVIWPGFSRSGATIAGGMLSGVSRGASADFTFILAIPLMFAASGLSLIKSYKLFTPDIIGFFAVGFVVSFIVALLAVVTFIKLVSRMQLTYFAYYRFVIAILFAIYFFMM
ncbi:undecaprenyl-diphosphate phosphatase [Paenibacillus doosanensis]|uniref:Undecaprenyl-diphosphatase n=1 Tax=Paenibacillus konkukensis TaxID=2020716 RepID=A0ABY4RMJ3_9BACL|nr:MULTISPECIES: undecaprenyl-diphosphate phosphatase [Paenibacillus]MCS7463645.1 undecaprenyl-diphosphate phosphatase [Paenibacillus doosanensis]UQZ83170.1 Undecaprenyl-diphosphatase [Paenibacillus konkukensis]